MKQKSGIVSFTYTLAMAIVLILPLHSIAQYSAPVVETDKSKVSLGEHIKLKISIITAQGHYASWPELKDTLTESIHILKQGKIDTVISNSQTVTYTQENIIAIFDSGTIVIPGIPVTIINPNDTNPKVLSSNPLKIEVSAPKVDLGKEIRDISPNRMIPLTLRELIPWIIGFLLLVVIVWLLLKYRKRIFGSKKQEGQYPKAVDKPPHMLALERLEALGKEKLPEKGLVKVYYTELTDILRTYFEQRFFFNALEMTSVEILRALDREEAWDNALAATLEEMLQLADLVKFAKAFPTAEDHENCLKDAFFIVNETAEASQEAEEKPEEAGI
jgi:hypothetical protein